jgi:hypothetical protein
MKRSKHSENFKLEESTSVEAKLWAALRHLGDSGTRLARLTAESTDAEVKAAVSSEFGLGGGNSSHGGYRYKGGAHPCLEDRNGRVILSGKRLIEITRRLLGIDEPVKNTVTISAGGKSVTVDADKFSAAAKTAAAVAKDYTAAGGYANPAEAAIAEARKKDPEGATLHDERRKEMKGIYGHIPACKDLLDGKKSRIPKTGMTPNFVTEPCPPVLAGKTCWKMASPFLRRMAQSLINSIPEHRHLCEARILLMVKQSIDPEQKDDNPSGPKRVHLGKAGKSGARDRLLSLFIPDSVHADDRLPIDFWIWVNGDWLETLGVKTERDGETHWTEGSSVIYAAGANKITALLDHELSHCGILIKGTFVFPKSLKAFVEDLGPRHVETCMEVVDKKGRVLVRYHAQYKNLNPVWKIRHHEVEDFVGVLARHGAWTEDLCRMVDEMTPPKDPDLLDETHDKVPA